MNTKEMPARDRREDRSLRQEKLGSAPESFPSKNLVDREATSRRGSHRPDKKHQPRRPSKSPGAQPATEVTFRVDAPSATQVCVAGCFNGWDPVATPLKNDANGSWSARLNLPPGTYQYRFVVDGEWRDDPGAPLYSDNPFGTKNAVIDVQ